MRGAPCTAYRSEGLHLYLLRRGLLEEDASCGDGDQLDACQSGPQPASLLAARWGTFLRAGWLKPSRHRELVGPAVSVWYRAVVDVICVAAREARQQPQKGLDLRAATGWCLGRLPCTLACNWDRS